MERRQELALIGATAAQDYVQHDHEKNKYCNPIVLSVPVVVSFVGKACGPDGDRQPAQPDFSDRGMALRQSSSQPSAASCLAGTVQEMPRVCFRGAIIRSRSGLRPPEGRSDIPRYGRKDVPAQCHDGVRRLNFRRFEQKSRKLSVQRYAIGLLFATARSQPAVNPWG